MIPFNLWWCCLNPRERNMAIALLPFFLGSGSYVYRSVYDAAWSGTGFSPTGTMSNTFIQQFSLTPGTVSPDGETVIEVLFFGLDFWSQLLAFSLTPDFICSEPCQIVTFGRLA